MKQNERDASNLHLIWLVLFFGSGVTPDGSQGILLSLHLVITPREFWETGEWVVLRIKPRSENPWESLYIILVPVVIVLYISKRVLGLFIFVF